MVSSNFQRLSASWTIFLGHQTERQAFSAVALCSGSYPMPAGRLSQLSRLGLAGWESFDYCRG